MIATPPTPLDQAAPPYLPIHCSKRRFLHRSRSILQQQHLPQRRPQLIPPQAMQPCSSSLHPVKPVSQPLMRISSSIPPAPLEVCASTAPAFAKQEETTPSGYQMLATIQARPLPISTMTEILTSLLAILLEKHSSYATQAQQEFPFSHPTKRGQPLRDSGSWILRQPGLCRCRWR